jgi:hypothetical protein
MISSDILYEKILSIIISFDSIFLFL